MVIVATRFEVVPGKMKEALEWADKVWKVLEKTDGLGSKSWIIRGQTGMTNRVTFAGQYASMGEFEEGLEIFKISVRRRTAGPSKELPFENNENNLRDLLAVVSKLPES